MKIGNIFLVLILVEVGLITIGGLIFSNIAGENPPNNQTTACCKDFNCSINNVSYELNETITAKSNETWSDYLSFSDSVFFVITTITTIGYGRKSPQTDIGKISSILIAFIGIPINIVFLAKIGEILKLFSKRLMKPLKKISKDKKIFIVLQIFISTCIGSILFLLIPGSIFMALENWTYLDSIYLAFITLFTIGYGDLVPAASDATMSSVNLTIYRIGVFIWIFLGMSYISLIINLLLEFLKGNADNLTKELKTIFEERLTFSLKKMLLTKKMRTRARKLVKYRSKSNTSPNKEEHEHKSDNATNKIKVKININPDQLKALTSRKSSHRMITDNHIRSNLSQQFNINEKVGIETISMNHMNQNHLNGFENQTYGNNMPNPNINFDLDYDDNDFENDIQFSFEYENEDDTISMSDDNDAIDTTLTDKQCFNNKTFDDSFSSIAEIYSIDRNCTDKI